MAARPPHLLPEEQRQQWQQQQQARPPLLLPEEQQQQQQWPYPRTYMGPRGLITLSYPSAQFHPSSSNVMVVAPGEGGSRGCEPKAKQAMVQDILPMTATHRLRAIEDELTLSAAREILRQSSEMEYLVRIQGDLMRQTILQKFQAEQLQIAASIKDVIFHKIQEKEAEVEEIKKKNMELEQLVKQLSVDMQTWQQLAKDNWNEIASLKFRLQEAEGRNRREGFGENYSEADASFCGGGDTTHEENEGTKVTLSCVFCGVNKVCMLLLPCRHLCLCKECETKLSFCPRCLSKKMNGVQISM